MSLKPAITSAAWAAALALGAIGGATGGAPAGAAVIAGPTLADAVYYASVADDPAVMSPGTTSYADRPTQRVTLGPDPAPFIDSFVEGNVFGGFIASGRIDYQLMILAPGGASDVVVPIHMAYSLSGAAQTADWAYDGFADAHISLNGAGCGTYECYLSGEAATNGAAPTSFAQSGIFSRDLLSGYVLDVNIEANARFICDCSDADHPGYGKVFAIADPVFTIDETFLALNPGFSVQFSAGIGNSLAPVPEPASWVMMIAGFALVGGGLRGRRAMRASRRIRKVPAAT